MILGLIPGERAGALLLEFIRGMCDETDENLQEWFAGCWPALLRNKPPGIISDLRAIVMDRKIDWFMRVNVLDAVIAAARREGESALEQSLDWAAQFAADESEDRNMRLLSAANLLDFPRDRHRGLLEELAAQQSGFGTHFDRTDVAEAYARNTDEPNWGRFDNPWQFYEPREIEARQRRWQEEGARDDYQPDSDSADPDFYLQSTYRREAPKIGRNDPCPCGSGKKYKKCCGTN